MISLSGRGASSPRPANEEEERAMKGPGSRAFATRARAARCRVTALAAAALLAVLVAACGSSSHSVSGVKGGSEVQAQAINTSGTNPFTASVAKDHGGVKPPPAAASSSGGPATYVASTPGLYGGTRNISVCDVKQLVRFLRQNQAKAAAWAGVLGIQTSQISSYVDELTPVLLRTDTRVTNHGYVDGHATTLQSVLEAGTAVLVDQYGRPTVKCFCGNPLTPPALYSSPVYTGTMWASFSTSSITIIQRSTTIIKQFILYDPNTGQLYPQTPGINGKPGPYQGGATTGQNTTPTANTQSTPSSQPENPSVSLSPNPVTAGDTVSLSATGFAPNADLAIDVNRPDGGTDHFSTPSDSSGNASYTFPNAGGSTTGTFTVTVTNPNTGAHASTTIEVLPASGGSTGTDGTSTGNTSTGNTGTDNTGTGTTTP
jgi:hypothetical protein